MTAFKTRLGLPYNTFISNPAETIRQSLGQHILIEGFTYSDVILPDDTIIVDVIYQSVQISPYQIYFVKTSDVKPIIPDSDKYITTINKCLVKITIANISNYPRIIPIKILSMLPNNISSGSNDGSTAGGVQISYFGNVISQPLNTLCTPIRYINHQYDPFELPPVKPIYPNTYREKYSLTQPISDTIMLQMCRDYKAAVVLHNILNSVTHVVGAKKFSECNPGTTAYVISFSEIPLDSDINGIILVQPKRIPNYVMFYPTSSCTICIEELESIKSFLEHDFVNYVNFMYASEVLNRDENV